MNDMAFLCQETITRSGDLIGPMLRAGSPAAVLEGTRWLASIPSRVFARRDLRQLSSGLTSYTPMGTLRRSWWSPKLIWIARGLPVIRGAQENAA